MSEYFFIRGYGDFKRPGVIPESFVEKAYGFYERRGAPFLQEIKKYITACKMYGRNWIA